MRDDNTGVLTWLALGGENKFRNTCREENLVDVFPSATHTTMLFQAYVLYERWSDGTKLVNGGRFGDWHCGKPVW